ncbi:hypothetical protein M422DRAFT_275321 [Sphaerobolus stellatus SS14]|uniref:NACHT domain-containing protein n=1 Tax=Sphaerobolus stellatus (strain SS14) TaxID=990650 RepID=A0A0C9UFN7_SPHS4|nr:hypothetical protein M422DRAFT_275321 [Sphaerobolus stellatus SS14]
MSVREPNICGTDSDEEWRKKKSAEFAGAMLEFARKLGQTGKKSYFTDKVIEQAHFINRDEDPIKRSRRSLEELRELVSQLDETHKKTSKARRTIDHLQPFFDGITRYMGVVETLVSSNPAISALVWGGVKYVVQLAGEYSHHYDNLTGLLESLEPQLNFLGQLSEIFDWSESLCKIIMKSYEDILSLFAAAAEAYAQSGKHQCCLGTLLPFDRKYKRVAERLDKNMQAIRDSAQAAQSYLMKKQLEDNEKKKIDQWLQAPATDPTYDYCINHKHPGTCEWLFENSTYQAWEKATPKNPNEMILWIYGPPGIGKTFLASSVIERFKGKKQEVLYYYFRDEKSGTPLQPGWGEALSMLRNLIRQLVDIIIYKRKHKLPTGFWDTYAQSGGTFLSDIKSAINVVQLLLAVIPRINVIIDGLDECNDRNKSPDSHCPAWKSNKLLPAILAKLTESKTHGIVKWCFTSCPESDLSSLFKVLKAHTLEVNEEDIGKDVLNYILDVCHDDLDLDALDNEQDPDDTESGEQKDQSTEEELGGNGNKEKGTIDLEAFLIGLFRNVIGVSFLDARLTLELLKGKGGVTTRKEMMNSIISYKDGFNKGYLRGLRVLAGKPRKEKELARRIITFVVTAERPLTQNELLDALAVQPRYAPYSSEDRPEEDKFKELLAPLLELDSTTSSSNPTVRFIHRTAREFIQQDCDEIKNLPEECKDFFPPMEQKHLELGEVCLAYLMRSSFRYQTTADIEKSLCKIMDEKSNSFLKYASIFWHHHLSETSATEDLFQHIRQFMRSKNFLTCLWVQSKWAPYQLARYTTEGTKTAFHIENPTTIFLPVPSSKLYYADPLPGWLSEYNDEGAKLVHGCQQLIKEYGLVLLRRRGGIRGCYPCSLGAINFLPSENGYEWRALPLQDLQDEYDSANSVKGPRRDIISVLTSSKQITTRTITLKDVSPSPILTIREWCISLSRKKARALKLKRQMALPFAVADSPRVHFIPESEPDIFALIENDATVLSVGSYREDLVRVSFETDCIHPLGFGIPEQIIADHPKKQDDFPVSFWRSHTTNGTISVVAYHWYHSLFEGPNIPQDKGKTHIHTRGDFSSDSNSDSDSDSNSDYSDYSESEYDYKPRRNPKYDSGYSSGSATSGMTGELKKPPRYISMAIMQMDKHCQLYHFETVGGFLKQSPPVVHPTRPFVIIPLEGSKTVLISCLTGEKRELYDDSIKQSVSRVLHFTDTENKLFEVITTRDFLQRPRWNIELHSVSFEAISDDINTVSITRRLVSSVSWVSPYDTPYEIPDFIELPFRISWSEKHLFLVFGACEVYIVRMLLDPAAKSRLGKGKSSCHEDSSSSEDDEEETTQEPVLTPPSNVQSTKNPAFLPSSTTERSFTYFEQVVGEKDYGCFVIAGTAELPPVLIRQDINADLGGWIDYDPSTHIGHDGIDEDNDMKGKYSCDAMSFHVPIRSGLAWNTRMVLVCGGSD